MQDLVLVVDDEPKIVAMIKGYLEASRFRVLEAFDGNQALAIVRAKMPDCVVLDINMPGMDGLEVARELRKSLDTPIIFLTALADETDRVVGLELGADDYVTKPFSPRELVARVKAVLRRSRPKETAGSERVAIGGLALDLTKRAVARDGRSVALTSVQFDILALMMRNPGKVWSRMEILESTFGSAHEGYERTIDAHVKNIRKALGDEIDHPRYLETVRGAGYRIKERPGEA
ncbi:MAG: response regulator transcription factor [Spirochaetaceae bacterium]|nr:response regulator transcription factor [Spirochaetaceae bacterium]